MQFQDVLLESQTLLLWPQMHRKHEPCKDTTHLGTEDFLKHLQSLASYADQACTRSHQLATDAVSRPQLSVA